MTSSPPLSLAKTTNNRPHHTTTVASLVDGQIDSGDIFFALIVSGAAGLGPFLRERMQ